MLKIFDCFKPTYVKDQFTYGVKRKKLPKQKAKYLGDHALK